jgi:molybdate transport system substrate-binding protein
MASNVHDKADQRTGEPAMNKLLTSILLLALPLLARAESVSVAVAVNFTAPMQKLAIEFEKESGHTVASSFASTGKLYAQIKNGAPFEVLLAADDETPAKLEKEAATVAGSRTTYASGRIVLWSAKPGLVDEQRLKAGDFRHFALPNPRLAPYGAAAVEMLTALKLMDSVQPKFVLAENLAQSYQFIATGNAELGIVALSQVIKEGKIGEGSGWIIPATLHQPIRQDAVLLNAGRGKPAAEAFLKFLKSEKAKAVMRGFGYDV